MTGDKNFALFPKQRKNALLFLTIANSFEKMTDFHQNFQITPFQGKRGVESDFQYHQEEIGFAIPRYQRQLGPQMQ